MRCLVLLLVLVSLPLTAGLIVNGGFETGDFTGWTVSGVQVYFGVDNGGVGGGQYKAWFGDVDGLTYIAQTLPTTPGQLYRISFWLRTTLPPGAIENNYAELWWGGVIASSDEDIALPSWEFISFDMYATQASTELKLGFMNPPGTFRLDEVSVVEAVPEPASLWLGGTGLAALLWRQTRRRLPTRKA